MSIDNYATAPIRNPTSKMLACAILVVLATVLFGVFTAVQVIAYVSGYDPLLGEPLKIENTFIVLFVICSLACSGVLVYLRRERSALLLVAIAVAMLMLQLSVPIYSPVKIIVWHKTLEFREGTTLQGFLAGAISSFVLAIVLLANLGRSLMGPKHSNHGTASWATKDEILRSGLLEEDGIVLGEVRIDRKRRWLRTNQEGHVLVAAPSQTGKGAGIVMPTLLSWKGSVIVNDLKGELWKQSAGWRKAHLGQKCIKLAFSEFGADIARWNPLEEVRLGTVYDVQDADMIASALVAPGGMRPGEGVNQYFSVGAREFLTALILHLLYLGKDSTLSGCYQFISDPDCDVATSLEQMRAAIHDPESKYGWELKGKLTRTHPIVAQVARSLLDTAAKEFSALQNTLKFGLSIFKDPIVRQNTSSSDFVLSDLMHGISPLSVYVATPTQRAEQLGVLTRLLVELAVKKNMNPIEFKGVDRIKPYKHQLLFLLDEIFQLGRIESLEKTMAISAGYGMSSLIVCQGFEQLWTLYGRNETVTNNCKVIVAFSQVKYEENKAVSDMLGVTTVSKNVSSSSKKYGSMITNQTSQSENIHPRALMTADEVQRLGSRSAIVIPYGQNPILVRKIRYFQNPVTRNRASVAPPAESDKLFTARRSDQASLYEGGQGNG